MNKIEINDKKITIDNVDYPKGIFSIIAMNDRLRLDFIATTDKIDIFAPAEVNGLIYESLTELRTVLSDEVFNLRWATSAEVSQKIAEAQLAGQEVDLSVYALKSELTPIKTAVNDKLNISDWIPYRNKVDALNTNDFALKTQLSNYALLSQLTDVIGLKIYTTQVKANDGVWEVTFPAGKFTQTPFIIAMALNDDSSSKNRANFASLDRGATESQCRGVAKSCVSGGLLATEMGNASCPVNVIAIGV